MKTAKIFKSGNSQAVRLPKELQFDVSEVEIFRRGDEIVLRKKLQNLTRVTELKPVRSRIEKLKLEMAA